MGNRIRAQRRGRKQGRFNAPSHRYKGKVSFPVYGTQVKGEITSLEHDVGRSAPLMEIKLENKDKILLPAPEDIKVGQQINIGKEIGNGNILTLEDIPEGTPIFCIESTPGSGPKFCRASGVSARIVSKFKDNILVELPSKKKKLLNPKCRAAVGVVAGGGRLEKPFVKAGKKHHALMARGRLYPRVSGVSMNPVDHPFGSGRGKHMGKPATAPRNAPPGRKVGLIRARRTGRKR